MAKPIPPCLDCKKRALACHDPETCKPWAEYLKAKAISDAAIKADKDERKMMDDYVSERNNYVRNVRRKET